MRVDVLHHLREDAPLEVGRIDLHQVDVAGFAFNLGADEDGFERVNESPFVMIGLGHRCFLR